MEIDGLTGIVSVPQNETDYVFMKSSPPLRELRRRPDMADAPGDAAARCAAMTEECRGRYRHT